MLNANASSVAGELPIDQAMPQVWVDDPDDAVRAREAIEEFSRRPTGGPARKCPACGEENPASFELCWACGSGLEN